MGENLFANNISGKDLASSLVIIFWSQPVLMLQRAKDPQT
jgi:hypothetical protein